MVLRKRPKNADEIPRKEKQEMIKALKCQKKDFESRFVYSRKDRCTKAFNISLFAQKEIIFVEEKPQTN